MQLSMDKNSICKLFFLTCVTTISVAMVGEHSAGELSTTQHQAQCGEVLSELVKDERRLDEVLDMVIYAGSEKLSEACPKSLGAHALPITRNEETEKLHDLSGAGLLCELLKYIDCDELVAKHDSRRQELRIARVHDQCQSLDPDFACKMGKRAPKLLWLFERCLNINSRLINSSRVVSGEEIETFNKLYKEDSYQELELIVKGIDDGGLLQVLQQGDVVFRDLTLAIYLFEPNAEVTKMMIAFAEAGAAKAQQCAGFALQF